MLPLLEFAAVGAAFGIALVFSMFGQGGGSLYTPTLVLLGFAVLISVSTSLVLNLITAAFATMVYYRQRLVDLLVAAVLIPGSVAGAFLGGWWGNVVNTQLILWIFVAFLLGAGARMLATYWDSPPPEVQPHPVRLSTLSGATLGVFGFGVGILSGLLGVGGGVVLVPFLIFALKVPTKVSAGTTAFVVIFSSLSGVLGHSALVHLDLGLIALTGVAVGLGGFLGARLMVRTRPRLVQVGFGALLWAFALQLILKLVGGG